MEFNPSEKKGIFRFFINSINMLDVSLSILGGGTITIGFDECGPQNSNTNGEGTIITSHIHHWVIPESVGFPISSMSQMTFQCNFK